MDKEGKDIKMNCSIYQYVKQNIDKTANITLNYLGNEIDRHVALDKIDKVAYFLSKMNLDTEDIITVSLPNMPEAVYSLYGANKIGIAVALLNPLLKENSLVNKLNECKSKVIFLLDTQYNSVKDKLLELGIKAIVCKVADNAKGIYKFVLRRKEETVVLNSGDILFSQIDESGDVTECSDSNKTAVLIHTSGTTGTPKASVLSNFAINCVATQLVEQGIGGNYKTTETMLAVLPIFHAFGLTVCFQAALFKVNIVLVPKFDKKLVVRFMKKYQVNYFPTVPTMLKKLLSVKGFKGKFIGKLRFIFCGGDKLNMHIKNQFNALLEKYGSTARIQEGYGLTEICGVFSLNPLNKIKENSVGKTFKENGVIVVDKNLEPLKPLEYGEILLNTAAFIDGYYKDKETSSKIFVNIDGKKWLRTGDIGYIDSEEYIYFVDRMKRSLKVGAVNVFPAEVEHYVNKLEYVDYSCVVRIKNGEEMYTKLLVQLKKDITLTEGMKKEINAAILDNLNKFSLPKTIEQVKRLNMTLMGKIDFSYYENN